MKNQNTIVTFQLIREAIDKHRLFSELPVGFIIRETKKFLEKLALEALKQSEEVAQMADVNEHFEDCFNCEESNSLYVKSLIDFDSGELIKYIYQECKHCGFNQESQENYKS